MNMLLNEFKFHPTGTFNNHAASYSQIDVLPLSSAIGAEIRGVDLRQADNTTFADISDAL